eukprot:7783554-Alexandrium_andersonii.AAC.1
MSGSLQSTLLSTRAWPARLVKLLAALPTCTLNCITLVLGVCLGSLLRGMQMAGAVLLRGMQMIGAVLLEGLPAMCGPMLR